MCVWRVVLIREFWEWPDLLHLPILPPGLSVLLVSSLFFSSYTFSWPSLSLTVVLSFLMTVQAYVSSESHLHKGQTNPGWSSELLCSSLVFTTGTWVRPFGFESSCSCTELTLLWNSALRFFRSILCCFSHYGNVFSLTWLKSPLMRHIFSTAIVWLL